uniref:BOS complex subunit NCLN n=1 Tax=Syphacia muris TaxID=451379 RepID=A0A0N5AU22_9BILA
MQEELIEELRNPFFVLFVSALLSWCVVNGSQLGDTVEIELKAYRLQQYDLAGTPHGSRSWKVMYEAVSLNSNTIRRSVIVGWRKLLGKNLQLLFGGGIGALIIVIPANLDALTPHDRTRMFDLERELMLLNTDMAVYVTHEQPQLRALLADVSVFSTRAPTAVQQLISAIAGNTFQFSSTLSPSNNVVKPNSPNIMGRLWALDHSAPVILLVAHYDTHSAVPALSAGADSNGSGVVALLELLALFSRFYASVLTKPKYNLVFLFTSGGKFNYQGTRQWIEDHIEKRIEDNIEMVMCLDSIGKGDGLVMHVSKMPADTTPTGKMFNRLKAVTPKHRTFEINSKKINLNADVLAWEHEKYSIKRLPAFTLSHFKSHLDSSRTSILDSVQQIDIPSLQSNIRVIAEALLGYIFDLPYSRCTEKGNTSSCSVVEDNMIEQNRIEYWMDRYASKPRLFGGDNKWLVAEISDLITRYTMEKAVISPVSVSELVLYGVLEDTLAAHRVKPAVFELFLAALIGVYLSGIYFAAQNVHSFLETTIAKIKKA